MTRKEIRMMAQAIRSEKALKNYRVKYVKGPLKMDYDNSGIKDHILAAGSYRGYEFIVINVRGSHPCGYVNVEGSVFEKRDYDEIDIECHGGLTFSSSGLLCNNRGWWIGWDYAHLGDRLGCNLRYHSNPEDREWTTEEVVDECKKVINQVIRKEDKK